MFILIAQIIALCGIINAIGYGASILSFFGFAVPPIFCYISIKNMLLVVFSFFAMRIGGPIGGLLVPLLWLCYYIQVGIGFWNFYQSIVDQINWGE